MTDAVIVSTARTGLAKSWKGAFNMTHGATLGGHVVKAAMERAGIDPGEVEDVVMGCAYPEGATGVNIAPTPISARPLSSTGSVVASAQTALPAANTAMPKHNARRRSQPPVSISASGASSAVASA